MKNLKFLILLSIFYFLFSAADSEAATLFLAPSLGSHQAGSTFNVSVKVNTNGKAINTTDATLTFDPTKLSVAGISKTDSIFSIWVSEPVFSNTDGTITFAGGKPSPGFAGSSGTLITVTFRGLTTGTGNVNFSSASVLADDGLGTNVLSDFISGAYTITTKTITTAPLPAPTAPAPTIGVPESPVIVSATHFNEDKWYSNNDPVFSWAIPSDVTGVRLLYNKNPSSAPTVTYESAISEKKLEDLSDGIYYFHVRFKNSYGWGEIAHRKILIDTVPPEPFELTIDNGGDPTNPNPDINYETKDALSGIEKYEVAPSPPFAPGKYTIEVKAIDKAGNFASASKELEVLPIEAPEITKIPISVRLGETLEVEGKTLENLSVRVYIQKGDSEPIFEKIKAGSDGKWKLVYDKALAKGDHLIWAVNEDERGAISYPTKKYSVEVGLPPFLKIGKMAIDYLTTMITLIVLLIGAGLVIFYAWYRISNWRKRLHKETGEVKENVNRSFRALREEVEEQIEFLDGKPGLNKDERKVRDKLKDALNISEEFIDKEIKDVEKELE